MIMLSRLTSVCLAVGAFVGCASSPPAASWTKAGATPQEVSDAQEECYALARNETWRGDWNDSWPPSFYDPTFMPHRYGGEEPFWIDAPGSPETEFDVQNFCLHSKGYKLVSVPAGGQS